MAMVNFSAWLRLQLSSAQSVIDTASNFFMLGFVNRFGRNFTREDVGVKAKATLINSIVLANSVNPDMPNLPCAAQNERIYLNVLRYRTKGLTKLLQTGEILLESVLVHAEFFGEDTSVGSYLLHVCGFTSDDDADHG